MIPFLQRSSEWRLTGCGWAGSARRLSYRDLDEKKVRRRVRGSVRLANGGIASMRAGCLPVVPAVDAAVPKVDLNVADPGLDFEHPSYLLCLAAAHGRAAVGRSWLDYDSGIRNCGDCRCHYRLA